MEIIDGKKIAKTILENIKIEISKLNFVPVFCDVLIGDDAPSIQYVKMKGKKAESVGIRFHNANFPRSISTEDLIKEIKILNEIPNMCGIIVQLPLPQPINKRLVLDAIDPTLDVDCLGSVASEKFYNNFDLQKDIVYPAALACMASLDSLDLKLKEKKIVVLGQGELVGKPVAQLLKYRNLDPIIITRKTENKEHLLKEADVIISGIGHGKFVTGEMVKKGVILIDAGTSDSNGGIVGDINIESVESVASYISPVPGGVGPVTVAMLLNNVLKVAKKLK
ncbi:MAG: bifunctional 5,10-methylenetetrahydrofolate dehydrogenase/5,10-methenyltetrahydrofolate cyclohydrolase [Candidatus Paceibacterota bacterium]